MKGYGRRIPVSVDPGVTNKRSIPCPVSSARSDSLRPRSANLLAQYSPACGIARCARIEPTFTTIGVRPALSSGKAARMNSTGAKKLNFHHLAHQLGRRLLKSPPACRHRHCSPANRVRRSGRGSGQSPRHARPRRSRRQSDSRPRQRASPTRQRCVPTGRDDGRPAGSSPPVATSCRASDSPMPPEAPVTMPSQAMDLPVGHGVNFSEPARRVHCRWNCRRRSS